MRERLNASSEWVRFPNRISPLLRRSLPIGFCDGPKSLGYLRILCYGEEGPQNPVVQLKPCPSNSLTTGRRFWVIAQKRVVAGSSPVSGSKCRSSSGVERVQNIQVTPYPSSFLSAGRKTWVIVYDTKQPHVHQLARSFLSRAANVDSEVPALTRREALACSRQVRGGPPFHATVAQGIRAGGYEPAGCRWTARRDSDSPAWGN